MAGSIEIAGYDQAPIANEYLRVSDASTTLAVVFPGVGYTTAMPLTYYSEQLLIDRGCDVLLVNWDYRSVPPGLPDGDLDARIHQDAIAAVEAGWSQGAYDRLVLVGKSLGTIALTEISAADRWPVTRSVWLTPLLSRTNQRTELGRAGAAAFVAIGTADQRYGADVCRQLRDDHGVDVCVIDGADHSMDLKDDVVGSIDAVRVVIERIHAFLARGE